MPAAKPEPAPHTLTINEAATAFGEPVSYIEAVARGRKLKGQETLAIPMRFTVETHQFVSLLGDRFQAVTRRELRGDGRLIWAIEHASCVFGTRAEAEEALGSFKDRDQSPNRSFR